MIRKWIGPLIYLPRHPRIRRDAIWQAGKNLYRRKKDEMKKNFLGSLFQFLSQVLYKQRP